MSAAKVSHPCQSKTDLGRAKAIETISLGRPGKNSFSWMMNIAFFRGKPSSSEKQAEDLLQIYGYRITLFRGHLTKNSHIARLQ